MGDSFQNKQVNINMLSRITERMSKLELGTDKFNYYKDQIQRLININNIADIKEAILLIDEFEYYVKNISTHFSKEADKEAYILRLEQAKSMLFERINPEIEEKSIQKVIKRLKSTIES